MYPSISYIQIKESSNLERSLRTMITQARIHSPAHSSSPMCVVIVPRGTEHPPTVVRRQMSGGRAVSVGREVSAGGSLSGQGVLVGPVQTVVVGGFELVLRLVVLQSVCPVGWGEAL